MAFSNSFQVVEIVFDPTVVYHGADTVSDKNVAAKLILVRSLKFNLF